jgi:hypothetical protein
LLSQRGYGQYHELLARQRVPDERWFDERHLRSMRSSGPAVLRQRLLRYGLQLSADLAEVDEHLCLLRGLWTSLLRQRDMLDGLRLPGVIIPRLEQQLHGVWGGWATLLRRQHLRARQQLPAQQHLPVG